MTNNRIPSLDLPGYPKPATRENLRDYCGVRFIADFETPRKRVLKGTSATIYELPRHKDFVTVTVRIDGYRRCFENVPIEILEVTN